MKPPYWNSVFDTLIPFTPVDELREMADRILCYPRHLVAALTPRDIHTEVAQDLLLARIVDRDTTRC